MLAYFYNTEMKCTGETQKLVLQDFPEIFNWVMISR